MGAGLRLKSGALVAFSLVVLSCQAQAAPVSAFRLSGVPTQAVAGAPVTFTVSALDATGALVADYAGTALITSSDLAAAVPVPAVFSSGVAAGLTLTFNTAGTQSVTATDALLTGVSASASVTVALPPSSTITAPVNVSAGANATATVPSQAGVTYAWSVQNGVVTAGGTARSMTFTAGASGAVLLSCQVTRTVGGASSTGTRSVNIAAVPTAPAVTAPALVTTAVAGNTASVAATVGMTYSWTIVGGTISGSKLGVISGGRNTVTFTAGVVGTLTLSAVEINVAALKSAAASATTQVIAAPVKPSAITSTTPVTAGSSGLTASVTARAGATYLWTLAGGTFTNAHGDAGELAGTTNSVTFTAGAAGTLVLTVKEVNLAGTKSAALSKSLTVKAAPLPPTITAASPVNAGQTGRTAQVTARTGFTYLWTIANGTLTSTGGTAGVTATGTNTVTYTAGAVGPVTLTCVERNGVVGPNGSSAPATASITVNPAGSPVMPVITATSPVSEGQSGRTASVVALTGMSYLWTIANGAVTSANGLAGVTATGRNTITYTAGVAGSTDFTCVESNGVATSLPATKSVTVAATPTRPSLVTTTPLEAGASSSAQVTANTGMHYLWGATNATLTSAGGTSGVTSGASNSVTFTAGTVGTLGLTCAELNAANVQGPTASASVQVISAPPVTPTISVQATVALGTSATASVVARPSMTYAWTLTNGTFTNVGGAAGVVSGSTNSVTFRPVAEGALVLTCVETNTDAVNSGAATATLTATPAGTGGIVAMPRLGLGRPIFGTNTPSLLNDGAYRASYAWTAPKGAWAALDLGAGPSQLYVQISNEDSATGDLNGGGMAAFHWLTSADSTNGQDGTWTTVATITANPYITRASLLPFSGQRWLKLVMDSASTLDEIDAWDASGGVTDAWMFIGDSITNRATKRGSQSGVGNQPSFQANLQTAKGQYPAQGGGGIVGAGAADVRANIDAWLAAFPHAKYWAVSLGTNDAYAGAAGLPQWMGDMQYIIDHLKAAGRVPVLARIPYTTDRYYGFPSGTALYNTSGIDVLVATNNLRPGPDLYTWFQGHTAELEDGVHPTETGCISWNRLWADAVLPMY